MRYSILLFVFLITSLLFSKFVFSENFCNDGERRICGNDIGICESGRSICKNGIWTKCEGGRGPEPLEICNNGLDDDCDGETDEDCFAWVSFILIGIGIFFVGLGLYYMQHEKGEIRKTGLSKD
ncbi:MAG: hypothetical protein QW051_04185 [Candidatus Aenigmatarchaeota archaeon]